MQVEIFRKGGYAMVREICRDEGFLAQKSAPAAPEDLSVAQDLLETLEAHKDACVGMAANMIGVAKRIIVFDNEGTYMVMFNPEIVKRSGPYQTEERCLSLTGARPTKRWKSIKVRYQNEKFQERFKTFTDWTAQIIQHEIDHCDGIII
jgi:peptide deformylase